ncbi:hypothetical protein AGLY_003763 [Aphis glycines]|uniref:Uncharacterized protein n=1 Tax=Aphis glycines TaxID=307491 RepID=A0A6G0TZ98_APHGL|nr:hypothetical protein AGLY_003763 [Aphis glycines]
MNSSGISCIPTYICKPNFRSGKTLRLFPEDYEQSAVRQGKARYPLHRYENQMSELILLPMNRKSYNIKLLKGAAGIKYTHNGKLLVWVGLEQYKVKLLHLNRACGILLMVPSCLHFRSRIGSRYYRDISIFSLFFNRLDIAGLRLYFVNMIDGSFKYNYVEFLRKVQTYSSIIPVQNCNIKFKWVGQKRKHVAVAEEEAVVAAAGGGVGGEYDYCCDDDDDDTTAAVATAASIVRRK